MGEVLAELLVRLLLWLVVLPVLLVVCTPVILIRAFLGQDGYWQNVGRAYGRLLRLWGLLGEHSV